MPARILEVTEAQYHADPCERPSLSHSIAHILCTESPRHAFNAHPRLGGGEKAKVRSATKVMDEGAILHALLLGKGAQFEMVVADDWRTKAAKESKEAIIAGGKIPILAHNFEKLFEASKRIHKNAADQGFPFDLNASQAEVAIEFTEEIEGTDILCRCRIDLMRFDHVLYDLKKVASANPRDIEKRIHEYGMDIQDHAYTRAYEQLAPEQTGRTDFVFLFVETEPPYEVVPARLDGAFREIGRRRWEWAVKRWHELMEEGTWPWPGYVNGAVQLSPPPWVMSQELKGEYL